MSVQTIESMAAWVKNNISNEPSLEDMASYVGYSPFYCSSKFHEHYGLTYKQFLAKCRLEAAVHDLLYTEDTVTMIAFRYGYSFSESLTRACVMAYQRTPRDLRKLPPDALTDVQQFSPS